MTTAAERLSAAIHLESAAISPHTSRLIEASKEALAEIERLTAENERLWAALEPLAKYAAGFDAHEYGDQTRPKLFPDHHHTVGTNGPTIGELRAARTAFQQKTMYSEEGK